MNLDTFLTLERRQLLEERQWLERKRNNAQVVAQINPNIRTHSEENCLEEEVAVAAAMREKEASIPPVVKRNEEIIPLMPSLPSLPVMDERTQLMQQQLQLQQQQQLQQQHSKAMELTKDAKEAVNKKNSKQKLIEGDWVTDTFYAYFPGFNNEYQKRQIYLRERQRQNQENFLKHFPAGANTGKENVLAAQKRRAANRRIAATSNNDDDAITNRSSMNGTTARSAHSHDKAELEIIVTNPNYVAPKYGSARPGSTRHKLLQDLRHTELSQIVTGDGISERNRRSSEMETARKKDYQRELMQQIEEKRRSIETLRDNERKQEQALTKRLQEQLNTLKLEEALEQERIYANKVRQESEQNRALRQELIAKLEQDSARLSQAKSSQNTDEKMKEIDSQQNKVYQYFSNSAQREYRRGQPLPVELEVKNLELPILANAASISNDTDECSHSKSNGNCSLCSVELQDYEYTCVRCHRQQNGEVQHQNQSKQHEPESMVSTDPTTSTTNNRSFSLICMKCERLYTLCRACLTQKDICSACYCRRNVCLNCRRAVCPVCLDAIVADADAHDEHIPRIQAARSNAAHKMQAFEQNSGGANESSSSPVPHATMRKRVSEVDNSPHQTYSTNIERNSIFHPDFDMEAIRHNSAYNTSPLDDINATSTPLAIERIRVETDKRLSHYFKHYGDLTELRSRSTQTTPESAGRRDVVLREEHNLSMPLLREMPKLTRADVAAAGRQLPQVQQPRTRIEQLKRRWEVPAVQKYTISPSNPKVLTQVGAIRKQLQAVDFN